jgi:hypothetical protein
VKGVFSMYNNFYNQDRFGFLGPFLLGGLVGGTAVGIGRPRPVYVNPVPGPMYPPYYGPRPPFYY